MGCGGRGRETGKGELMKTRWPGPFAEMCQGILMYKFWMILLEDFRGGLFWALFPTKSWRNNPATNSVEKSGGPNI